MRQLREARGLTLDAAAEGTHVKVRYLEALEQEDTGCLLGPAYAKSFLKAYAQFLDADPVLIDEYRALLRSDAPPHHPVPEASTRNCSRAPAWWIGMGLVGAAAFMILVLRPFPAKEGPSAVVDAAADSSTPYLAGDPATADTLAIAPGGQPMAASDTLSSLQIVAVDSTWVEASADGQLRLHELLLPGEVRIIDASREYLLTLGNAGGAELSLNGERLPSPGPRGMVIRNMLIPAHREPAGL
ncbi:MAG: DUF4115 domain-containing protein [Candidatus Eisenbacteria bacterium]|nr:DUF4115 domain-containing protein [Candidatus Eisenbacteria bacterium]